jgi:fatty-acyl-CoA synthase
VTLPEALARLARAEPAARALSQGDRELSYGELGALVEELAGRLAGAGVRAGDRVALLAANSLEWVLALHAGLRAGAIVVPLNTRLGRLELERQLAHCEPRVVLADEQNVGRVGPRALRLEAGRGFWD